MDRTQINMNKDLVDKDHESPRNLAKDQILHQMHSLWNFKNKCSKINALGAS